MKVKELFKLMKTINEVTNKLNYVNSINQIRNSLTQYKNQKTAITQNQTPQQKQTNQQQLSTTISTLDNARALVLKSLSEIQIKLQDYDLIKTFNKLKIDNPYSNFAKDLFNRTSSELDTNIDSLITEMTQYYQKVNSYQQFINSISAVLGDVIEKEKEEKDELILFFEGGASIDNLKELSKVSNDWNQIVNCFGRLTKENDTDIHIVSIERGSLVATLAVSATIIIGITKASDKVLDLILKIYEIRKKALELKQMKLETISKAIEILEKQSTVNLPNEATTIVNELMKEYGWEDEGELFHETKAAAIKAVKKIIKFQNSGGKLDSKIIMATEQQKEISSSLKEKNIQFLKVEDEVKNLTDGKHILQLEEGDVPENEDSDLDEDK